MASRERDDAMAGLLKRNLAGDAGAENCPEPEILAAYFERALDTDETTRVEIHLAECARCREQVAALGRAEAEAPVTSAADARRKAPRASWMWDWRWLAPVAAVLVIAAVWATRRPALDRLTNDEARSSASATPSQPALQAQAPTAAPTPPPEQHASEPAAQKVQPPSAPAAAGKKAMLSRIAPAAPAKPPSLSSQNEPVVVNSRDRDKSIEVERSPQQSLQSSQSTRELPLVSNYTELNPVSKGAPGAERKSAEDAANAPPGATSESVTVESTAAAPPPAPAAAAPKASNGIAAGVAGGVMVQGAENPKQERAAAKRQDFAEAIEAQQSVDEQRSASFVVRTPDKNIFWRIHYSGFVERSIDGGATWNGELPNQHAHYTAGSAPSADVCWLAGDGGIILLTQDGSHWRTIPAPLQANFTSVTARDAWNATVTAADGRKFTTSDQGTSWTSAK